MRDERERTLNDVKDMLTLSSIKIHQKFEITLLLAHFLIVENSKNFNENFHNSITFVVTLMNNSLNLYFVIDRTTSNDVGL
jgi:hypothetical protein